jgi:hypothetical protein
MRIWALAASPALLRLLTGAQMSLSTGGHLKWSPPIVRIEKLEQPDGER